MKSAKLDPNSRNWTMEDVNVDPRFVACKNECIIAMLMYLVHVILIVCDYVFLASNPPAEGFTFILGMPVHILFLIGEFVFFIGAIVLVIDKVFKDMDMSPIGEIIEK